MTKLLSLILGGIALVYFSYVGIIYSYQEGRQAVVAWALKQPEAEYTKEDTRAMDAAFMPPKLNIAELDEGLLR